MLGNELKQLLFGHSVVQECDKWKCGDTDIRDSDNGDSPVALNNCLISQ